MSETAFRVAKGDLAFSQSLMDSLRQQNMAQQSPEMGMEAPMEEQEQPMEEPLTEQPESVETQPVEEMKEEPKEEKKEEKDKAGLLSSFMDEVRALFKGKEDEEKKTQELIEKHNKEIQGIKKTITDNLSEEE